jgi:ABC-type Fe3+-citrate transport system substrate-binding protein
MGAQPEFFQLTGIISSNLVDMSLHLYDVVHKDYLAGKISQKDYSEIINKCYFPILQQAAQINLEEKIDLSEEIRKDFEKIKEGTEQLKQAVKKIKQTQETINSFVLLFAVVASLSMFVASPSPATFSTVISSIAGFESSLNKQD